MESVAADSSALRRLMTKESIETTPLQKAPRRSSMAPSLDSSLNQDLPDESKDKLLSQDQKLRS